MTEAEESKETKDGTEGTEGALGFQEDTTADPSKATEAVEKPAEPAAEPVKPIYLAGRAFTNRTELQDHVKKIQDSKVNEDASKGDLTVEENLFIFHLLLHHPKAVEKMTKPISHFRYGTYDKFKNKCFISVAVDGTEEGVSAAKSMSVIFPNTSGNGAAATSSATAGLVAVPPPDEKKEKGQKRNREERPPPEPRVFEPQEMVRGCVVDIKGLPPNVNYGRLKELLNGCGKVKFLQLLKVPKASKEPPQKKAKVEEEGAEKADAADAAEGEKDEDPAKEEEAEEEEESPVTARAGEDVHAASAAHGGRGEGKEQGHEAAEPSNFGGSMAHHPAQPPIQPERGPEAVTTITEVSQAAQTMVIGATGDAGTLLQPHAELPAVAEEAIQADADRQADASASQSRLDQLGVSQTSMQGSHGSQGVSQTSFHVSQTTFQVSQSTFQASHTTFDPGEPTQSTFQTGHNANLFNSTAPAVVGVQQGPRVPPLWDPHPRSDGFYGWEARSPSDASDADHPALPADTLPTFVPAVDDRDATLPASDLHGHWADPGAQTVKPHSGFTARSGYSDDSSGQSPRPGQPIVNTSILTQLCNLLNAPDTPDSEVERVRRGPLRKVRTPEEQSPAWGGGVPSASAASPISPFQAETEVTITTSPAKTKKSMHSAARSADETLPSLHPSTSGPHDAYGHEDDQSPFQTVPMFQSDLHSPPERRDRRVPEEPAADLFQRRTPRSHQEAEELVDPNLISQLCHLLNAPDTPSSAAAAAAAAAAAEVHKPSRAAAATAEASKVKQPSRAKPAEETLQRPSDPMSGWAEPGETLPMFQSDLHSPQTPDERRARRDREHARHRADPFDMDFDQTATARTDEESRQQSLVDPNLIAQLCRLLNQPETPPSDTERIRREPPPRRAKEQPGLFRADPQIGGESQPHTARTSVRSRGTASDQASGDSDVNEALEEDVFNIMDMLCVQIEEPQA